MAFTPIIGIGAVGATTLTALPKQPSTYRVTYYDVSKDDAGRTSDGKMWKETLGACVKIEMSWNILNSTNAKALFDLFKSEYFDCRFFNPYTGGYDRKEFYCGDRTAPLYNASLDIWQGVAFNIIQRTPSK